LSFAKPDPQTKHAQTASLLHLIVTASPYLEIPLPAALAALTAATPAIVLFGWAVSRRLFDERLTARIATIGVALGSWVIATHIFGLVTRTLTGGILVATLWLAAAGAVLHRRDRGRAPLPLRHTRRELVEMLIFAVGLTVPIAVIAWRWSFHDELGIGGHQAMIAQVQNDHYPPRSLAFPQFELAYHYGFDLLCAMLTGLLRVRVTTAIDLATCGLWFYSVLAVWLLGERLIGRGAGPLAALVVLLGGGAPSTCGASMDQQLSFATHFLAFCEEGGVWLNPGLTSYFFQHPWTLGLPLALTILLVETEDHPPSRAWQLAALIGLFAALYITQVTAFLCFLGAVIASRCCAANQGSRKLRILAIALLAVCGVADVFTLGGFFAGGGGTNTSRLLFHPGVASNARTSLWWMVKSFGLPLVGLLGFTFLRRRRILFASLAAGSLLIINTVRYQLSWDIAKFATVAGIGFTFSWSAVLARLQAGRTRLERVWAPACLIAATVASSVGFLATLALGLPGIPHIYSADQPLMTDDARQVANLLRRRMPADAVMYRRLEDASPYATYSGLPQVWLNPGLALDAALEPPRTALATNLPAAPEPYLEQHVRFFVLDAGDERLNVVADAWLAKGQATLLGRFGALRVVELLTSPTGTSKPTAAKAAGATPGIDAPTSG
jgi:hypothetical protein